MSVNKVILIGNVGADPEVKEIDSSRQVATFSLATSESYKDKHTGEKKSDTTWHSVVAWNALAGIVGRYVRKGSKLYVEGKIKTRTYVKDGTTKYITEILADQISLLGEKPLAAQSQVVQGGRKDVSATDELPWN